MTSISELTTKARPFLWIAAGLFLGWLVFAPSSPHDNDHHSGHEGAESATTFSCSMHPEIRQQGPGKCPLCGMELTPVADASSDQFEVDRIRLEPGALAAAGIQTAPVRVGTAKARIQVNGTVVTAESGQASITSRISGRLERLFVSITGTTVQKGQLLAEIYSPELIAAQRELLESRQFKTTNPSLYDAARRKLENWNIGAEEIALIEQRGKAQEFFPITAPMGGTVTEIMARTGENVESGMPVLKITDLSQVWIQFDVFEKDIPFVGTGDSVRFFASGTTGLTGAAKLDFIEPVLDSESRTLKVRTTVSGGRGWIPGMIVQGTILSRGTRGVEIPASALLWAGGTSYVWVKTTDETFEIREVRPGMRTANGWLIARGLNGGEEIAVQGVFRLDAAAQLSGRTSMLNRAAPRTENGAGDEAKWMKRLLSGTHETIKTSALNQKTAKQLNEVAEKYLAMTAALVQSDFKTAKKSAKEAAKLGEGIQLTEPLLLEDWKLVQKGLKEAANAADLTGMRKNLNLLSMAFAELLEQTPRNGETLYLQYCPMARNDVGGFWLSRSEAILNPYFGASMLECGETISQIK
jgi:Cu(I)/Ag(I) efflux system membrane fusion protein